MSSAACARAPAAPSPQPNVLLVTIDTFRADRLGTGVAPALDRLAASGLRFTTARAAVPLTLPSHTTILTGLLPPVHGVRENGVDTLSDAHPTIARLLKTAGYETAAFVGAFVLDRRFGLAQGFDTYDDQIPRDPNATERLEAERPASAVVDRAIAWLDAHRQSSIRNPQSAFFVWIHLYDPHAPYNPPDEFRARTRTPYDGEIAFADAEIARVFEWLRAHGQIDRTLVVVAGDHGEGLGDHGERTHGMLLYDSTLRVPLIIASPGRPAGVRDEAVSLVDLAPTIVRAAGVTPPDAMNGRDLLEVVRLKPDTTGNAGGRSVRLQADLYSESEYPRVAGWTPLQALTDGRWMTIRAGASSEVYDLQTDPGEQHNVATTQATIAAAMAARIDAIRARATHQATAGASAISKDAEERLRALGYVASSAQTSSATGGANPATRIATWNAFEEALSSLNAHRADALTMLSTLATANPDAPVFQTTYARALKDAGQVMPALAAYRQAARRWPRDATLLHDLAVAAREAALVTNGPGVRALRDEAARAEQAAVALAPGTPTAHNGLGLTAIDDDRPRDAVTEFERATALDPNNASYWTNLGNARRGSGDSPGAEQAYRRAIEADPKAVDAANGIGVLMVEAHRPADATSWFERALTAAPDFVEARLNLGIALQNAGNTVRAAEAYRLVLAARGNHPREKDAAAKLLAALGAAR
jgi:choline-sulfatase